MSSPSLVRVRIEGLRQTAAYGIITILNDHCGRSMGSSMNVGRMSGIVYEVTRGDPRKVSQNNLI